MNVWEERLKMTLSSCSGHFQSGESLNRSLPVVAQVVQESEVRPSLARGVKGHVVTILVLPWQPILLHLVASIFR